MVPERACCATLSSRRVTSPHYAREGEHQQLAPARLDALQSALWDQAMAGDVETAREVRAVIMARCRLLGLDQGGKRPAAWAPRTVVVSAQDRALLGI